MRDKCICIKTYHTPKGFPIYSKNIIYEYTDQNYVTREYPKGYNVQFSKGEYLFFRKHQDPLAPNGYGIFNTHFKKLKELRKEKLEKLKNKINI